ncbi:hypothetical protein CALK_1154 [Chitinivibrio alkaliphilus ACht1]|uniref:Uncharacterized protein n=1 Tax=Chitinivibrio alkaliphilus ACht1 TaxID=1313304 RepID=U7DBZ8_9BACT|nr:hypothetical protein CALK_1154 [Chitinivibrio alkaliphilus ACht1]
MCINMLIFIIHLNTKKEIKLRAVEKEQLYTVLEDVKVYFYTLLYFTAGVL